MKTIDVTAAVIENNGKFLIAKRKQGKHLAGKWEFPGGKIEENETAQECLARELQEEFGIQTEIGSFLAESVFDYGDRTIRLLGYHAKHLGGEFQLNDHDEIQWVSKDEFSNYDFAEADIPIIQKIISA